MKRLMTIAAVAGALTCHNAVAQESDVSDALQGATNQASEATSDAAQATEDAADTAANRATDNAQDSTQSATTRAEADLDAANVDAQSRTQADAALGDNRIDAQADADLRTDRSDSRLEAEGEARTDSAADNRDNTRLDANARADVRNQDTAQTDFDAQSRTQANAALSSPSDQQAQSSAGNNNRWSNFLPAIPFQARTNANAPRDAQWRFTQRNGEWWYYSPENQWMYYRDNQWETFDQNSYQPLANNATMQQQGAMQQQEYSSGYRGALNESNDGSGSIANSGQTYVLRHDNWGREFICVHGQRVYFDNAQGQQTVHGQQNQSYQQGQHDRWSNYRQRWLRY